MKFIDLLNNCSPMLIENKKIKLLRHRFQDDLKILKDIGVKNNELSADDLEEIYTTGSVLKSETKLSSIRADVKLAEISCAEQGRDILKNTQIVFAFAASKGSSAEFIGAFNVLEKSDLASFSKNYETYLSDLPNKLKIVWGFEKFITKLGYSKRPREVNHYYKLELLKDEINDYKNRIIIDWGQSINWVQKNLNKEIIQIRAKGFVRDFTDYYDFVLSFDELKAILSQPEGNPEWISKLSGVSGVYLILDIKTGNQYIGSAYGARGFLGRWESYSRNNHGGNKSLLELVKDNADYASNFQISILRVMDKSSSKEQVINAESFLKHKLGTKVYGLNNN